MSCHFRAWADAMRRSVLAILAGATAAAQDLAPSPTIAGPPVTLGNAPKSPALGTSARPAHMFTPALMPTPPQLAVNLTTRAESRAFFRAVYSASNGVPLGWTGSLSGTPGNATGNAGATSAAFQAATALRINWFRAMAGIPAVVTFDSTYVGNDQLGAAMMSANNSLSHNPPQSWSLYSVGGEAAAVNSNLALGYTGPDAISSGYICDAGLGNEVAGHRRWLLYPQTQTMGTGDVPATGNFPAANANWVLDGNYLGARPATREAFVAWPPPGYVPANVVFARWSFAHPDPDADLSHAVVTMSSGGKPVGVSLETPQNNIAGEPTLIWEWSGLNGNTDFDPTPPPAVDTTYTVHITGIVSGGQTQNYSYNVTLFDPNIAGPDDVLPSLSGPAQPLVGLASDYTVAGMPDFADGFRWRAVSLAPFVTAYGAEGGLQGVTPLTTGAYNPMDSSSAAQGSASYHLAMPTPQPQFLTLPGTYYFASGAAALTFQSRLGWASPTQVATVQISTDDGANWVNLWTQPGTNNAGETSFALRTVALNAFAGRTFRIRFAYTVRGNPYFAQTTTGVGWNIDVIGFSGVSQATTTASDGLTSGGAFQFTPAAAGAVGLQAGFMLFGQYTMDWGPLTTVTAVTTPPVTYPVTPSADAGGAISPNIAQAVDSGGSVAFTATPNAGLVVDSWLVDGSVAQSGGLNFSLTNVQIAHTVEVSFVAAPIVALSGNLSFGSVATNAESQATLQIFNNGAAALHISSVGYPPGFSGNYSSGAINPGASQTVQVTFAPTAVQSYSGSITVMSDAAAGNPAITVSGVGLAVNFPSYKGNYVALLAPAATFGPTGRLSVTLGTKGAFTANLVLNGKSYAFHGIFSPTGMYHFSLPRQGGVLTLAMTAAGAHPEITGALMQGATEVATLGAFQTQRGYTLQNPAPLMGRYTVALPLDSSQVANPAYPQGIGAGQLRQSFTGSVKWTTLLGDGTPVTLGGYLDVNGHFLVYKSLYGGQGVISGSVAPQGPGAGNEVPGQLFWSKAATHGAAYPAPFAGVIDVLGSIYAGPPTEPQILPEGSATLGIASGGLAPQTENLSIAAGNRVTGPAPDSLAFSVRSGLFLGRFRGSDGSIHTFRGVALQKQNVGYGFFKIGGQTGSIVLQPK